MVASLVNLAVMAFMLYIAQHDYANNNLKVIENAVSSKAEKKITPKKTTAKFSINHFQLSEKFEKLTRFDLIAMAAIMLVYGAIALHDLGDMAAPETEADLANNTVTFDLGKDYDVSKVKYFLGSYNLDTTRTLNISYKNNNGENVKSESYSSGSVFCWAEQSVDANVRYISLSTPGTELTVKEFAIMSGDEYIKPVSVSGKDADMLFDEQTLVPERRSFKNGTYFDEIYHARTAYEFIHHLEI